MAILEGDRTLCRFYTAPQVSELLVRLMRIDPLRVVDLGSGLGSLTSAAAHNWPLASITTVDIDPSIKGQNSGSRPRRHVHIVADALGESLPDELPSHGFDAAVCNPPYSKPEWRPGFRRILDEAGIPDALEEGRVASSDVLFTAQNLRLTRKGGQIGLVVPDGAITGRSMRAFRRTLLDRYRIDRVVQLPRFCFRNADAQAFLLTISKCASGNRPIELLKLEAQGSLSETVFIDPASGEQRLDYEFHATKRESPASARTLRSIGAEVVRGSVTANNAKSLRLACFHTTDFPATGAAIDVSPKPGKGTARSWVKAEPGDILIARVGRNLHKKVCVIKTGRIFITDCVLRIRVAPRWRKRVLAALSSEPGQKRLKAMTRGTGARLIAKNDLLEINVP